MGRPVTDYSAVAANALTGSNDMVQGIPDVYGVGASNGLESVATYVIEAMEILNNRICVKLDAIIQNQQTSASQTYIQTTVRSSQIAEFAPILLQ